MGVEGRGREAEVRAVAAKDPLAAGAGRGHTGATSGSGFRRGPRRGTLGGGGRGGASSQKE